ncbi:hypothetical protein BXY85_2345 [Roseivirga pacifica]|uniref:DUF3299 domain-containing protein n=1 Tax=Roseivirga pacifica TaxID=1267423 RepID=A0A1I0NN10_9BACT|nr:hypothetical protein [Roseivirga pacifica]RKQ51322.1 hypothetical protein BXY85_2345 [Roseivirga pacifica]SEW02717.1 hypothetical protein SAMN05216290_1327 [Roseivirga pacifica]
MRFLFIFSFLLLPISQPEGWEIFGKVVFEPQYFEELDMYFEVPVFDKNLIALENSEVTLSGYHIPLALDSSVVISSLPFSSCFFCGGAGPETVAEIQFSELPKNIYPDQLIKARGKLKLNATDVNHMNFILTEAKLIE